MAELIDPFGPNAHQPVSRQGGLIDPFGPNAPELRSGPTRRPGEPMGRATPIDDPAQAAGVRATLTASLMADPQKQIEVYAKARGMDPRRYGVDREGNIYYIDMDGIPKREVPSVMGATGPIDFLKRLGANIGSSARSVASQVAAAGAGAATIGGSPILSIPAAGGAAATVDAGSQALGNYITGNEGIDWGSVAKEGLMGAAGQGLTVGVDKAFTRNALKASPRDIQVLKDPQRYSQYQQVDDLLRQQGITGTPGEITGANSLLARERQLGRFDETATTMGDFYRNRSDVQIPAAFDRTMGKISSVASPGEGARLLQSGADDTIKALNKSRAEAASPIYQEAFAANKDVASNAIDRILLTPAGKEALAIARERMQNRMSLMATPDPELTEQMRLMAEVGKMEKVPIGVSKGLKLQTLDLVKQSMDDMIAAAQKAAEAGQGRSGVAGEIRALKNGLLAELDRLDATAKAGPVAMKADGGLYAKARKIYVENSPEVSDAKDGLIGLAAKDRASGLQNVPRTMFDITSADPISVTAARQSFEKAGKIDEWNAGLRAHLTNMFTTAQKNEAVEKSFYRAAYADPKRQALLKAAMSPEQFTAFDDFMKALDTVRKALPLGSPTATDLGGKAAFAGPGARTFGAIPKLLSPQNLGDNLSTFIQDNSAGRNAERIANIITQPGAIAELKKLRMIPPTGKKALAILDNVLVNYGGEKLLDVRQFSEREPYGISP